MPPRSEEPAPVSVPAQPFPAQAAPEAVKINPAEDLEYQVETAAKLVEQGGLVTLKQGDTLSAVQPQHLVRLHEVPLGVAAGLRVGPGAGIDRGEQGHEGHLVAAQPNRSSLGMVEVTIDGVCGEDEDSPPR